MEKCIYFYSKQNKMEAVNRWVITSVKRIFVTFLLFCSLPIFAQYPDWKCFGKSQRITTFAEEGDFMWIGNYEGVVKLNKITGAKTFYNKANSPLTDNAIYKIVVDNKNVKWFGTANIGLVRFDGTNWTIYDTLNTPLPSLAIRDMDVDANNNLWISTYSNGGLIKYDGNSWTSYTTANSNLPDNEIGDMLVDGTIIWVTTNQGLAKFDGTTWTVYNSSNSTISTNTLAIKIDKDKNGNLWLLQGIGLEKFDGNTFTLIGNLSTIGYSLTIDADNIVWVGSATSISAAGYTVGGISSFNGTWTKYDTTNTPISDTDISEVYADKSNHIWIGGQNGSVDVKNRSSWTSFIISNVNLYGMGVNEVAFDQQGVSYILSSGNPSFRNPGTGIVKYDWTKDMQINNAPALPWAIATDRSGKLYEKTSLGLYQYDGTNWTKIPNTPPLQKNGFQTFPFTAMATDTLDGLWMNYLDTIYMIYNPMDGSYTPHTEEGIAHYDGANWTGYHTFYTPSASATSIYQIKVDHLNNVWASTGSKGLLKYDGKKWVSYTTSNSTLQTNSIQHFTIDATNNIWFSDLHYGLMKFDGTTCTTFPNPAAGANPGGTTDLETDIDGSIWQLTFNELIRFDGTNWNTFNYQNAPISRTVDSKQLSIDKFGNKWIGTNNGLLVYKEGGVIALSVKSVDKSPYSISAFPNPFENGFEIQFNEQMNEVDLTLYDELGRQVFHKDQRLTQTMQIPRNGLKPGIYFYQVKSTDKITFSGKVMAR
jgi:ligand-binding sensor domain-containing protein